VQAEVARDTVPANGSGLNVMLRSDRTEMIMMLDVGERTSATRTPSPSHSPRPYPGPHRHLARLS